ncbi:MAG: helix-hairpin-helix domain-containing protein [Ruminococcus sp.]|uniref:ComEA family DNA-binding protein n=1 Tax=Ruminococcus sp. TaxID=41978 RepID=UPI00287390E9|nr:helix-hairpin-helix domain-containing protein [Ruminococcus sp.]MBQ3284943.1 helix-hairpin-helix domain-containing protein [Ruminococcus sp.]
MKRFKNGKLIWIIGAVGLIAVIGVVLFSHLAYQAPPRGYTPQEIDAMEIEPVNINTASAEELNELSGVSEKQAQSIVAYREEHGAFTSAEEIMQVEGVGKKTYERIAPYITVS